MSKRLDVKIRVYWAGGEGYRRLTAATEEEIGNNVQDIKLSGFSFTEPGRTIIIPCYAISKIVVEQIGAEPGR